MSRKSILYIGNDFSSESNYSTTQDLLSSKLRVEGFKVKTISKYKNYFLRILDIIVTIISKRKVDFILIDVFSTKYFYLVRIATLLARFLNIKYITILHGGNLPQRLDRSEKSSKRIFNNSFLNVSPSGFLKYEFEKRGYKAQLIPNTIEIANYPYEKREIIEPTLLWVRSFRHLYNPVMAIEVVQQLKPKFPNIQLCMIGPIKDDSIDQVREKIEEYTLQDHIEITGGMEKKEWINKSKNYSIFMNTTNVDNTPVSVIEAMALGKVIVSTNVGGIPYLLEDEKTAYLVNSNDATQMSLKIEDVLLNNINTTATNARKVAESYDWETIKYQWIKILE